MRRNGPVIMVLAIVSSSIPSGATDKVVDAFTGNNGKLVAGAKDYRPT
jgi:hypothetical protein